METEYAEGMMELLTRAGIPEDVVAQRSQRKRNSTPPLSEPVYIEDIANRVYNLYECDFQRLGYVKDSWRGLV